MPAAVVDIAPPLAVDTTACALDVDAAAPQPVDFLPVPVLAPEAGPQVVSVD